MTQANNSTLIQHLTELKKRLIICLSFFVIATIISYVFVEDIYSFLVKPLASAMGDEAGRKMIFTGLAEAFITYLKLAIFSGVIVSFPILAWQIYAFSAPGLYDNEKKFFFPFIFLSPALFIMGAAFVYYFLFPMAWKFFLSFEMPAVEGGLPIKLEAKISEYLSLVTSMIMAFGITFQMPLVVILLVKVGLVTLEQLKKFRKYAVIIILTVSAFLTPPDVLSQIAMATPLYLLYEISIIFCSRIRKRELQTEVFGDA
jgi:sec-independent protein translocase protein TatC